MHRQPSEVAPSVPSFAHVAKGELMSGLLFALLLFATPARAQGNYEIQVYGSDTVAPKTLMVELHSNFTPEGQKNLIDGVYPTNHQEHETIELT